MSEILQAYFPKLTRKQQQQFAELKPLYEEWNAQINVISRKDMEHFYERHVLHSLSIAFYWRPKQGAKVLDIGTGGGFPGIPLAILYPEAEFLLVDSIGKKIKVAHAVIEALGLTNVTAMQERAENLKGKYDVVLSRAVARLAILVGYCTYPKLKIDKMYCLKGGDLREEVEEIDRYPSTVYKLDSKLKDAFFETKKVVYVQF